MKQQDEFEKHLNKLYVSKDEDGSISHYHLNMKINNEGRIEWLISYPSSHNIDLTDKII